MICVVKPFSPSLSGISHHSSPVYLFSHTVQPATVFLRPALQIVQIAETWEVNLFMPAVSFGHVNGRCAFSGENQ